MIKCQENVVFKHKPESKSTQKISNRKHLPSTKVILKSQTPGEISFHSKLRIKSM